MHEPGRIVEYKPLLEIDDNCVIVQREALTASLVEGRDLEWKGTGTDNGSVIHA